MPATTLRRAACACHKARRKKPHTRNRGAAMRDFATDTPYGPLQAKLSVGPARDAFEIEADRVADQVMRAQDASVGGRAPGAGISIRPIDGSLRVAQCRFACGGGCPTCRAKNAIQKQVTAGPADDVYERVADRIADQVMLKPSQAEATGLLGGGREVLRRQPVDQEDEELPQAKPRDQVQRQPIEEAEEEELLQTKPLSGQTPAISPFLETRINGLRGGGQPLPPSARSFFEARFAYDFSGVRVHTGHSSANLAHSINARAFTVGRDIVFGQGQYAPSTTQGRKLLAHELTHFVQQSSNQVIRTAAARRCQRPVVDVPSIQRQVEVRPPGRGEASAFDRREELVDRLNAQSAAIQYRLEGRALQYEVADDANLTHFDRQMQAFIDRDEVIPMRLITGEGYVQGAGGAFQPLSLDSFLLGYVDLDDLLASDELGFQARLIHFLTERFATRNYERRIGTAFTQAEFDRAHRTAHEAEAELFQELIGDPTIRFLYAESRPNGTWVVGFRSDEGYRIFRVVRGAGREVRGAEVWVRMRDRRRLTVEELIAERAAAVAPAPAGP